MDPYYKSILVMRRAGGACQHSLSGLLLPHPRLYFTGFFTLFPPFTALTSKNSYNSRKEHHHKINKNHDNGRWGKGIPVNDIYLGRFPLQGSGAIWKDIQKKDTQSAKIHFASWYDGLSNIFLSLSELYLLTPFSSSHSHAFLFSMLLLLVDWFDEFFVLLLEQRIEDIKKNIRFFY